MSQLFLDRIENLISVINLNLPEVFLDTLSKNLGKNLGSDFQI